MSDDEINELIEAGRRGWEHGGDVPDMPTTHLYAPQALYWLGYMFASAG